MPRPVTILVAVATAWATVAPLPAASVRSAAAANGSDYTLFESAHVRPLALSAAGDRLYAVNTPDGRLEIFEVVGADLVSVAAVPVGLEPVAVALRDDTEAWVVNHLSDSISIVDLTGPVPRVVRTLLVGDEPRDIVFAGTEHDRAFVTTAHRGQNSPVDPELTTQGRPRADVWVFDADDTTEPLTILSLFGDTPRALAASPDGSTVWAAVFRSGNRTTTLAPGNLPKPPPHESADGVPAPDSGLIVQFDGSHWRDEAGVIWDVRVGLSLPDLDVFEIDATAAVPQQRRAIAGVGTTLLNLAVNPANGALYVSNLEALNPVRFSGFGSRSATTVRGHFVDHRITVIRGAGDPEPRDLNPHLDFSRAEGTAFEMSRSLAMPMSMEVSPDGKRLYVAAFGSNVVAALPARKLERGRYRPRPRDRIELSAGGPTGLVLSASGERLYAMTRYDNGISVVDTRRRREIGHVAMPSPEPVEIVEGRPFLYDATLTSGRGNGSCGACHLFGDTDALAWDLGDPEGTVRPIPLEYIEITPDVSQTWHPMKGPMVTQSMRGLANHGPMHWRGDRSGVDAEPGESVEEAAFREFNEAFVAVQGRREEIAEADMRRFTEFALRLTYPPNPIRALDNELDPVQEAGRQLYFGRSSNTALEVCSTCHPIRPQQGVFGTRGLMADNGQTGERDFKVPHFRDQYQKVGMFSPSVRAPARLGDQVRGFGFNHNGATSGSAVLAELPISDAEMEQLRQFLFAFPSDMAPIVGQQVTLRADSDTGARERVRLLLERAAVTSPVPECDLVAKAVVDGVARGWWYRTDGRFHSDRDGEKPWRKNALLGLADSPGQEVTFTCTPPGSGRRIGIDRDADGVLDGDEATASRHRSAGGR